MGGDWPPTGKRVLVFDGKEVSIDTLIQGGPDCIYPNCKDTDTFYWDCHSDFDVTHWADIPNGPNAKVSGAGTASAGLPGYTAGDNTE